MGTSAASVAESKSVAGAVAPRAGRAGGWILLDEPELHLGADVVVPDLAGWGRERMPTFPHDAAYFTLAPDWVGEVLSPSTATLDRGEKLAFHFKDAVVRAEPVDAIPLELGSLWPD